MTWGVSTARRRPGDLLTRGDVCHLHADRDGAERCGAAGPGAPDLVRLEQYSERVYRVLWSLSDTSGGELRRPMAGPASAGPAGGPRLTAGAVPDADMIRAAADALGVDVVNLRRRRAGGQS
jgi:hypothetical protein